MVFPEPSRLKPCLTSWVTPFQTLQLHEKSFRTCGHRELKLVSTCLNHMTAVLREKTSLVKIVPSCHLRVGPLESEGFPSTLLCWTAGFPGCIRMSLCVLFAHSRCSRSLWKGLRCLQVSCGNPYGFPFQTPCQTPPGGSTMKIHMVPS